MTQKPTQSGFLNQSRHSSSGLAIVIGLHGAAIAVALLAKSGAIPGVNPEPPIPIINIDPIDPPPANPIEPQVEPETAQQIPTPTPLPVPPSPETRIVDLTPVPPIPGPSVQPNPPAPPAPTPEPVRRDARFDPSHMAAIQPRYPSIMLRQEREGSCTIRVRIGTNGRVIAAEPVRSTHPSFCEATQSHALRRWRFQPATRDGVPVESWQQHTVEFRIS